MICGSTFIISFSANLLASSDCSLCACGSLVIFHVVCVGHSTLLPPEPFSEVFIEWSNEMTILFAVFRMFCQLHTLYLLALLSLSYRSLLLFLVPPSSFLSCPLLGLVQVSLNPCINLIFVYHAILFYLLKSGFSELD